MKKFLSLAVLSVLFILALAACAPVSGVIDRLVAAPVSAAQEVQPQSAPAIQDAAVAAVAPASAASQPMTGVQLFVFGVDRSIRIVDVALPLNPADKPAFNGLLPTSGVANNTVYLLDSTGETRALAATATGVGQLTFIQKPASYGLAVWPGSASAMARLAWASGPSGNPEVTSLQISALDGSQLDTLLSLDIATLPLQYVPEYWSADGQWLYFSQEPMGLGGYILFSGASNLYKINISTTEVKQLIPQAPANGPQACLDSVSADFRYVADHCTSTSITVRDLFYDLSTTIKVPREISPLVGALGSTRFSPDGSRVAFALARSNPDSEQGWVAVSDSLSGESKLLLTSPVGTYYTVAGWLDSQTLLVQSTNLLSCAPYCSSELWAVRIDGTFTQKLADGSLIIATSAGVPAVDNPLPIPVQPTAVPPTAVPPTAVPPTPKPVPPTATPVPCNLAEFVKDVTVKDGTVFGREEDFTKTWRLKNVGTCTWTQDYDLVFRSGDQMDGPNAVSLSGKVRPGETVDLSVDLTSPKRAGEYTGYWALRDDAGRIFGIGTSGTKAFWVNIEVVAPTALVYDFSANYCDATWSTSMMRTIPCPSLIRGDANFPPIGGVTMDLSPKIETGYVDNEPALITSPDDGEDGYVHGTSGDQDRRWRSLQDHRRLHVRQLGLQREHDPELQHRRRRSGAVGPLGGGVR
jgi:hypothetical protein